VRALDNWLSRMGRVEERVSQLEETHEEE